MRLYVTPFAPNPLRVQLLMREKSLSAELVDLTRHPELDYRRINPLGHVPALELDDGTILTESLTICHYLDATSGPPFLFGAEPLERARIGLWERRAERLLFDPAIEYGHHVHPMFAARLAQSDERAEHERRLIQRLLPVLRSQLGAHSHVAGDGFSAADLTAYLGYFAAVAYGAIPAEDGPIAAWAARMAGRDSVSILRDMATAFGTTLPGE